MYQTAQESNSNPSKFERILDIQNILVLNVLIIE